MVYEPLRFLKADELALEAMSHGDLQLKLADVTYQYVKAISTHPTSDPLRYISLRATPVGGSGEVEIGVLVDVAELCPEGQRLVKEALSRRYFVHVISRIHSLREEFGYLYWDVDTDRGRRTLVSHRWSHSQVVEMGPDGEGRIVLDVYGNRNLIHDLTRMDQKSQALFERYIYW